MAKDPLDAYAYTRQILLPALGLQNHPFVILRPGAGGTASRAFRISIERAPGILLRLFDDRARAGRSARALRHLERVDLPAPRLKHAELRWTSLFSRSNGFPRYATAETWIEGVRAIQAPNEEAVAMQIAQLLARFHAVTRPRWGRPGGLPEIRPYAATTLAMAAAMLNDLTSRGILSEAERVEASARMNAWRGALLKIGTFQLVHNDANRRNFIVTPEKTVVPVDVQRISYEPCAEEVANALYHFCRRDEAMAARFLERYLAAAAPKSRESWERTGLFFTAFNTLKRLHRRTGPEARAIVSADEVAPGDPPGVDARIPQWKATLTTLPRPPKIWPEPGSAPPSSGA
jgi:Ser/Thr protein kinase RdoA (MazF antagonist)